MLDGRKRSRNATAFGSAKIRTERSEFRESCEIIHADQQGMSPDTAWPPHLACVPSSCKRVLLSLFEGIAGEILLKSVRASIARQITQREHDSSRRACEFKRRGQQLVSVSIPVNGLVDLQDTCIGHHSSPNASHLKGLVISLSRLPDTESRLRSAPSFASDSTLAASYSPP